MRIPMKLITAAFLVSIFVGSAVSASGQEERAIPAIPDTSGSEIHFDASAFQADIRSENDLGTLAKKHVSLGDPAVTFGFAAKSVESKYFIIGSLYSEALAYLRSNQFDLAAKRLESIEEEFINLQIPSSLYNYISKTRNMLERKKYSKEVLEDFLALFQPFYEDFAKNQGSDKLTLFRAGSWLVNMGLTAAAKDTVMLAQADKAQYFTKELKRLNAPKGVLNAFEQITQIAGKEKITRKDARTILKLVKEIQGVLA